MADNAAEAHKRSAPKATPKKRCRQPRREDGAPKRRRRRRASARTTSRGCKTHFEQVIRAEMTKQFGYTNPMQVPMITKVVLNMGIGEGVADRKKVDSAAADLSLIAGQKAVITKSRKSIATYKLRDGQAIGAKVTLRKTRMYDFLDRLVNIALPRVRDFRGLESEELRRPRQLRARHQGTHRVPGDRLRQGHRSWGLDITVCTTARNDDEARALLTAFNFPFRQ